MEIVFHLIVVPCCPMSQSQRISPSWAFRGIDKAGYFGAAGYSFGRMEKVFHFIVVPCCPMSQSQRISPSWAFRGIDKAGYFGPAGYFGVGWRKLALSVHSIPFSSILTFLWFGNTPPGSHCHPCYSRKRHAKTEQCNYNP